MPCRVTCAMVLCASIETENDKTREKHAAAVYKAISSAKKDRNAGGNANAGADSNAK